MDSISGEITPDPEGVPPSDGLNDQMVLEGLSCRFHCQGDAADIWLVCNSAPSTGLPVAVQGNEIVKKTVRVVPTYLQSVSFGQGEAILETLRKYLKRGLLEADRERIVSGILAAISYLHNHDTAIIHGNINPGKIYITQDGNPKLGEFGLSRIAIPFPHLMPSIKLDNIVRWMGPECFPPDSLSDEESESASDLEPTPIDIPLTTQSDMWAFGCTLLEIMTSQLPYHCCKYDAQVIQHLMAGKPPGSFEPEVMDESHSARAETLRDFIIKCWLPVGQRPSAQQLIEKLEVGQHRGFGPQIKELETQGLFQSHSVALELPQEHAAETPNNAEGPRGLNILHLDGGGLVGLLGEEHSDILTRKNKLALTSSSQGRRKEAEQSHVNVLDAQRRTLGEEHPNTLTSMNNLASTYSDKGRWDEAEQLQLKVLEARARMFGKDHPHTLTSMNNLASTYSNKGKWDDAEQLQLEVLEAHTRTLGKGHLDTLRSMSNLASTYWKKGRWDDAEQLQLEVLKAHTRMFGKDHPHTLTSMNNLASTYSNKGKWDDAEQLQRKVLEAHTRTLGKGHLDTLRSMSNLASTYWKKGRWDAAEQLQLKVLKAHARTLGEDHPDTLRSMGNLASTYSGKGRRDDAEKLEVKVLEAHTRTLGEDHPETLTSMNNLASTYRNKGRWDDAEQLQLKVLEAHTRTLGEDHPDTLRSMSNLASTYWKKGRWDDAEQLQLKVLEAHTRVLGKDHPDTLTGMHNLALTYADKGRWDEAEHLLAQAVEARARIIGDQNPDTVLSRECLVHIQRRRLTTPLQETKPQYARAVTEY